MLGACGNKPAHGQRNKTSKTVWKIAKTTTALTAAVSGKLVVPMTKATPAFRVAVVKPIALRRSTDWPAANQPAATMGLAWNRYKSRLAIAGTKK